MTYILLVTILIVGQFNTSVHLVDIEFSSKQACEAASTFYVASIDKEYTVKTVCVEK